MTDGTRDETAPGAAASDATSESNATVGDAGRDRSATDPDRARTHALVCDRFGEAFTAVFELIRPETTAALVRLDEDELSLDIEGDDTAAAWESVRDRFERVAPDDGRGTAWRCPTTTAEGRAAFVDLFSHAHGVVGAYFVREIELRRDGRVLASAVPHHSQASVDAARCGRIERDEIVNLADVAACLAPTETDGATWVEGDREWSVSGGSLRVERLDGRRGSCYDLSNLRAASVAADGTLELTWDAGRVADGLIGRALTRAANRLYSPPTAVPCSDPERATSVRARMQELLDAYDGRDL